MTSKSKLKIPEVPETSALRELGIRFARVIEHFDGVGYCLMMFHLESDTELHTFSNADPDDMLDAMQRVIDHMRPKAPVN